MSSTSAYIVPFDHQSTGDVASGLNPAQLWALTPTGEKPPKVGTTRTFFNTPPTKVTTLSSLGDRFEKKNANEKRELLRKAVGGAVKDLKAMDGLKNVAIDASLDPQAAGMHTTPLENRKLLTFFV